MGTCRAEIAPGAACSGSRDVCQGNALCANTGGGTPQACTTVNLVREVGGACAEAVTGLCDGAANLFCDSGRCRRVGDGTLGAPCRRLDFSAPCNAGLACDSTSRTCQPQRAAGGACNDDDECLSGRCFFDTGSSGGRCAAAYCD
jgi:hypothetical protein